MSICTALSSFVRRVFSGLELILHWLFFCLFLYLFHDATVVPCQYFSSLERKRVERGSFYSPSRFYYEFSFFPWFSFGETLLGEIDMKDEDGND